MWIALLNYSANPGIPDKPKNESISRIPDIYIWVIDIYCKNSYFMIKMLRYTVHRVSSKKKLQTSGKNIKEKTNIFLLKNNVCWKEEASSNFQNHLFVLYSKRFRHYNRLLKKWQFKRIPSGLLISLGACFLYLTFILWNGEWINLFGDFDNLVI